MRAVLTHLANLILIGVFVFLLIPKDDHLPDQFQPVLMARDALFSNVSPYEPSASNEISSIAPGILVALHSLPAAYSEAWPVFLWITLIILALGLIGSALEEKQFFAVLFLMGGALAWVGLRAQIAEGRLDLLAFGLALLASLLCVRSPFLAGILIGIVPWLFPGKLLLIYPFVARNASKGKLRMARLLSGVLLAWFSLGAALPSLAFGSERALKWSQEWAKLMIERMPHGPTLGIVLVFLGILMARIQFFLSKLNNISGPAWIGVWLLLADLLGWLVGATNWTGISLFTLPFIARRLFFCQTQRQ